MGIVRLGGRGLRDEEVSLGVDRRARHILYSQRDRRVTCLYYLLTGCQWTQSRLSMYADDGWCYIKLRILYKHVQSSLVILPNLVKVWFWHYNEGGDRIKGII